MKRSADKTTTEDSAVENGLQAMEAAQRVTCTGNTGIAPENGRRIRPEVAVLGWNVRSYRLSLRGTKA